MQTDTQTDATENIARPHSGVSYKHENNYGMVTML